MTDSNIVDLCKKIYEDHKEAIDLINSSVKRGNFNEISDELEKELDIVSIANNSWSYWFLPKDFPDMPKNMIYKWYSKDPIAFWIRFQSNNKIRLIFEVGPLKDSEKRLHLIKKLADGLEYAKFSKNAFNENAKYSRFFKTPYIKIDDFNDEEEVIDKISKIYKEHKKEIDALVEIVRKINWNDL